MIAHVNPQGHRDRFRSAVRQRASDQMLGHLIQVATGEIPDTRMHVSVPVRPSTHTRAYDLTYAAAWHHDSDGRWLPGSYEDRRRLVHRIQITVEAVETDGFDVSIRKR